MNKGMCLPVSTPGVRVVLNILSHWAAHRGMTVPGTRLWQTDIPVISWISRDVETLREASPAWAPPCSPSCGRAAEPWWCCLPGPPAPRLESHTESPDRKERVRIRRNEAKMEAGRRLLNVKMSSSDGGSWWLPCRSSYCWPLLGPDPSGRCIPPTSHWPGQRRSFWF